MSAGLLIPLALLIVPILEIAVFILLGGEIGIWPTLAMIFVTAVIGTFLLRLQGFALLSRIRKETEAGRAPGRELVHGTMILVAGVLLLTPGFVTDALGFLLFVPPVRDALWKAMKNKINVSVSTPGGMGAAHAEKRPVEGVVDLDEDEWTSPPDPTSPWKGKSDEK